MTSTPAQYPTIVKVNDTAMAMLTVTCSTKVQYQAIEDLERRVDHLKGFVRPLRTFLEHKLNVGRVAAVRRAAEAAPSGLSPQNR